MPGSFCCIVECGATSQRCRGLSFHKIPRKGTLIIFFLLVSKIFCSYIYIFFVLYRNLGFSIQIQNMVFPVGFGLTATG